jgi:hypothetical protein
MFLKSGINTLLLKIVKVKEKNKGEKKDSF